MDRKHFRLGVSLLLAVSLLVTGAFAAGYNGGTQGNPATFETLQEARTNGPAAVATLETNDGKTFKSHPVLDNYPEGTTFVYRSANLYGGRAAARLNTDILVFSDQSFADKDAALAYLKGLGVTDIVDKAIGSVVLVTPSDPKAGFTSADQKYYYALQTAMFAQKALEVNGDTKTYYCDAEYFGGFGYTYVIGIDGGASFLNDYVANTVDYVGRIAGMLLIGGSMDPIRKVATVVPTYLVNAPDAVIAKYQAANATNASLTANGTVTYFNQTFPLQKVVVASVAQPDAKALIQDAYDNLFSQAMRIPVLEKGLYSASSPYQGYSLDQAPYSLCARNAVVDGVTKDGIHVVAHTEDRFQEFKTDEGEYLKTWFEYLPDEVLNNTAAAGTVPLVLANHGSSDDPRVLVDEFGLLELAGQERFAIVAPEHQYISGENRTVELQALPALVKYMLATYPSLDASRVYVMGYSMGAGATLKAIYGDPSLFAAAAPMSPIPGFGDPYVPDADALAKAYDGVTIPVLFATSGCDLTPTFDQKVYGITPAYQTILQRFIGLDGLTASQTFDFNTYPVFGLKADRTVSVTLNNEHQNTTFYLKDQNGVPMVGLTFTEGLVHALYPEYGKLAWNFVKQYSRNPETGAITYNPYAE